MYIYSRYVHIWQGVVVGCNDNKIAREKSRVTYNQPSCLACVETDTTPYIEWWDLMNMCNDVYESAMQKRLERSARARGSKIGI